MKTTIKCSHGFPQNNTLGHDGQVQHSKWVDRHRCRVTGRSALEVQQILHDRSHCGIIINMHSLSLMSFAFLVISGMLLMFLRYSFERRCLKFKQGDGSPKTCSFGCLSSLLCRKGHLQEELSLLPSIIMPRVLAKQWNKFLR